MDEHKEFICTVCNRPFIDHKEADVLWHAMRDENEKVIESHRYVRSSGRTDIVMKDIDMPFASHNGSDIWLKFNESEI